MTLIVVVFWLTIAAVVGVYTAVYILCGIWLWFLNLAKSFGPPEKQVQIDMYGHVKSVPESEAKRIIKLRAQYALQEQAAEAERQKRLLDQPRIDAELKRVKELTERLVEQEIQAIIQKKS